MKSVKLDCAVNTTKNKILGEAGFSLVELLTACSVLVFVVLAVSLMLEGGYSTYGKVNDQIAAQEEARRNLFIMAKYIRQCKQITQAGDYELIINSDIDDDSTPEKVRFYLLDANGDSIYELKETVDDTTTSTLGRYVVNMASSEAIFAYYRGDGDKITDMEQAKTATRTLTIALDVDVNMSEKPDTYKLESTVRLRNFD